VAAVPADTNTLPLLPLRNTVTHFIDDASHLMPRNAWILDPGPRPFFREHVAVAHSTGLHLDSHMSCTRLRNLPLDDLEITGAGDCGVRIAGASAAVLRANWIHSNAGCGVSIGAGSSPRLIGNRISENGTAPDALRPGIDLHPPAAPVIENNFILGNGQPNPELAAHNATGNGQ